MIPGPSARSRAVIRYDRGEAAHQARAPRELEEAAIIESGSVMLARPG
jgi:hypothetical protein